MLAAILAPPVAVVAASTVPAALVLLRSVEPGAALGGGAFFGTAFGGLIVGPFAWAGYAIVAVLVATRSMTRRRAAAAIAAIWGTTALLVVGVVTLAVVASASRTAFGWEEARALLIATA